MSERALQLRQRPRLVSNAKDIQAYLRGNKLQFIRPSKPVDNAPVEGLNEDFKGNAREVQAKIFTSSAEPAG